MNALEMKTLMTMPEHTLVPWGPGGQVITVGEALRHLLRGEGVEIAPAQPVPGQPGQPHAGPNITISQVAVDSLSQAQYDELQQTGHLQGLTNSDNGRANVHVRQGGSISIQRSFNPETGAVEAGRGLDLRDFDPPAGS
jgi:hypothetical protein